MYQTVSRILLPERPCKQNPDETVSQRIPHIAAALNRSNVTCVQFKYDGQLGYRAQKDPIYLISDGTPGNSVLTAELNTELRIFFDELLELRFPNWANAEGAHGEFQWDLGSDRLAHAHFVRCEPGKPAIVTGL